MATDPLRKFVRWHREAERAGAPIADAMVLATVDRAGRPSARYVLLKGVDSRGFVFYTNERSRKGKELAARPAAALAFYWHETGRQVRVEGNVALVADSEADAYWDTRPRGSQIASAVSQQSRELASRASLLAAFRNLDRASKGASLPRPEHWRGYVLAPRQIEFWTRREPRLHERELFVKKGGSWSRRALQP